MISLLMILLLLLLLFLFLILIMLNLKKYDVKNVLASRIRKRLKTLGLRRETLKRLNRRNSIFVIIVEQLDILDLIAISG